ncbi:MAG: ABC transporter substrate-binding protein [Bdellovibrionota bacterium]|nr:MAG: ABC transporter substrate-binding protein [Bdellovibrionota bacterium]
MDRPMRSAMMLFPLFVLVVGSFAQAEIRVGIVAPLSGDFASYGSEIERGASLAIEELQQQNGVKVQLVAEDACLPAAAVAAAKKLLQLDKIDALVGSYCVIGMVPMAPHFETAKVIAFHSSAVADEILDAGEYIFTTNVTIDDEAKVAAEYARKTLGADRAAILFVTSQWGQNYNDSFARHFKDLGGTVVSSSESSVGTNDFRAELTRAAAGKPEVLFSAHVGPMMGSVLKQARSLGMKQTILAPHEAAEPVVIQSAGGAAEGLTVFAPRLPRDGRGVERFTSSFEKRFGYKPGILAANAYDATHLAVEAITACGPDRQCVRDRIYKTKEYHGMSGVFSITAAGGTVKPFSRLTVDAGVFREHEGA